MDLGSGRGGTQRCSVAFAHGQEGVGVGWRLGESPPAVSMARRDDAVTAPAAASRHASRRPPRRARQRGPRAEFESDQGRPVADREPIARVLRNTRIARDMDFAIAYRSRKQLIRQPEVAPQGCETGQPVQTCAGVAAGKALGRALFIKLSGVGAAAALATEVGLIGQLQVNQCIAPQQPAAHGGRMSAMLTPRYHPADNAAPATIHPLNARRGWWPPPAPPPESR